MLERSIIITSYVSHDESIMIVVVNVCSLVIMQDQRNRLITRKHQTFSTLPYELICQDSRILACGGRARSLTCLLQPVSFRDFQLPARFPCMMTLHHQNLTHHQILNQELRWRSMLIVKSFEIHW